jgi:hypothetical protein
MDRELRDKFQRLWAEYFPKAELPIAFYYTNDAAGLERAPEPHEHHCVIADLGAVRKGESLCFGVSSLGCQGAKRYFGFSQVLMPGFEHFLSCGIPGKLEGERYKKSPEIVLEMMKNAPVFVARKQFIVFKRWDGLEDDDSPEAVIFFARPDVLSGLFTLSGFDEADPYAVVAPFSAGCGSIVQYPCLEQAKERPRAVLGMFDVSARPWVQKDILTFAVPMRKFTRMIENMDESFLITHSWERVRARL